MNTTDFFTIDNRIMDEEFFKYLFVDSQSLPLGYNKNCIQVIPDDYSSIIAFALGSNLYFEGL